MQTKTITIGNHSIVIKEELQRKDLVLLGQINQFKNEFASDEDFKNSMEQDMSKLMQFTDILAKIFIVSIDGETDKEKILEIFGEMGIEESNELVLQMTKSMENLEKKRTT